MGNKQPKEQLKVPEAPKASPQQKPPNAPGVRQTANPTAALKPAGIEL